MLDFKKLTLDDRSIIEPYLFLDKRPLSNHSFTWLWIWSDWSSAQFCIKDGFLYLLMHWDKNINSYYFPLGNGNIKEAIKNITDDAKERNKDFLIDTIPPEKKAEIIEILGDDFKYLNSRPYFDYIYSFDDLKNLTGKKYHAKRNFINRFKSEYENRWEYMPLSANDKDEIIAFFKEWEAENISDNPDEYKLEFTALNRAFDDFDKLKLVGGKLYVDGKLVAFTVASPQNDEVLEIHFEKSLYVVGGYQMISNTFLLSLDENYKYINREEDMGLEGLRKSKLSLHPLFLAEKYAATNIKER
jgi:hypothetical protein